jgi:hypothetical protein
VKILWEFVLFHTNAVYTTLADKSTTTSASGTTVKEAVGKKHPESKKD